MKTVFSVGSAPRLYEDTRPAEEITEGVLLRWQSKMIEKRWQQVS
jgi:hypothetical protein